MPEIEVPIQGDNKSEHVQNPVAIMEIGDVSPAVTAATVAAEDRGEGASLPEWRSDLDPKAEAVRQAIADIQGTDLPSDSATLTAIEQAVTDWDGTSTLNFTIDNGGAKTDMTIRHENGVYSAEAHPVIPEWKSDSDPRTEAVRQAIADIQGTDLPSDSATLTAIEQAVTDWDGTSTLEFTVDSHGVKTSVTIYYDKGKYTATMEPILPDWPKDKQS